jgi:hypothetical protein
MRSARFRLTVWIAASGTPSWLMGPTCLSAVTDNRDPPASLRPPAAGAPGARRPPHRRKIALPSCVFPSVRASCAAGPAVAGPVAPTTVPASSTCSSAADQTVASFPGPGGKVRSVGGRDKTAGATNRASIAPIACAVGKLRRKKNFSPAFRPAVDAPWKNPPPARRRDHSGRRSERISAIRCTAGRKRSASYSASAGALRSSTASVMLRSRRPWSLRRP